MITPGYVNDPAATADIWRDGWYHSGDVMRRDVDGHYFFTDRIKDAIRRRGENISSVEVETAVLSHPAVTDCAALGVGDAGEQEVHVVVIRDETSGLTEGDLIRYLVDRLPYYAVPRFVSFVAEVPRTQTGKIQKTAPRAVRFEMWDREEAGITVSRPGRPRPAAR